MGARRGVCTHRSLYTLTEEILGTLISVSLTRPLQVDCSVIIIIFVIAVVILRA